MGQIMGSFGARNVDLYMDDKPTFDTKDGFSFERKPREMIAREEDLISARIPAKYRDYCAHYLLEYQVCRYNKMPLLYKCAHEKHNYLNCEHDEYCKYTYERQCFASTTASKRCFRIEEKKRRKKLLCTSFKDKELKSSNNYVLRMKEFERERRLRLREQRVVEVA